MSDPEVVQVQIHKFDPGQDDEARLVTYEVPYDENMRVLDVLQYIYVELAPDIAFQYACRIGRCGTCAVKVNGRAILACQERAKLDMTLEPITPFPVMRDLVVDRTEINERFEELQLAPQRPEPHDGTIDEIHEDVAYKIGEMGTCIGCMICVSSCPAVEDRAFSGPAFIHQLRRLADHPSDTGPRLEQAMDSGMLECFGCDACVEMCPAELSPIDAIRSFRREAIFDGGRKKRSATRKEA